MKKINYAKILNLCVLSLFLFSSCEKYQLSGGVSLHGVEKYDIANSNVSISKYLLLCEDYNVSGPERYKQ
jgi:hypothetical protein